MYRRAFVWGLLYVAFDRGSDWRTWLCALFRAGFEPNSIGKRLFLTATVGPVLVSLRVL